MTATKVVVTCDACERDLTCSANSVDYRLRLSAESVPACGSMVTDMMVYPPIGHGPRHFCGIRCLGAWIARWHPAILRDGS